MHYRRAPAPATMGRTGASLGGGSQSSAGRNSGTSSETGGSSETNASSDSQGGSEESGRASGKDELESGPGVDPVSGQPL